MGLLDHLWDDTVAGPPPDSGLGKLRKSSAFSFRSYSGKDPEGANDRKSFGEEAAEGGVRVTRSIMIVKPPMQVNQDSPPVSPAGSTPPVSPFAGCKYLKWGKMVVEGEKHIGLGGGLHRMRRAVELDPGALLLLTTCDI